MRILFCGEGFSESRRRLAPLLTNTELATCRADRVLQSLDGVDVIVPYVSRIDRAIISGGRFGLVQQFGVGLDGVDLEAATSAGVWVARVPSAGTGNAESVAEHALLLMLALSRRLPQTRAALAAGEVGEPAGLALWGKTACIVGLGDIGSALALRLQALGMRLIAVRRRPQAGGAPELGVERVFGPEELHAALALADYVILCVNYDQASRNLIDGAALQAMKRGAFVINVARGGLVDPDALLSALRSGHVAGAGLDVFWEEPPDPRHPLFKENVIATPHIAGVTDASYVGIAQVVADNVKRYARGEAPRFAVNTPSSAAQRARSAR
ncbi:MAG TPA: 2-hydroxyacid dehydrogenase [Candidatus Eremiobacteraceae bacterium]|nr:2-hydroxyacid dehydrogenase [Candidatus Eremiobacteraceae bacterium]